MTVTDADLDGLRARPVRSAARFAEEYWREPDRNRRYPHDSWAP